MLTRGKTEPGHCITILGRWQIVWWPDVADWRLPFGPLQLRRVAARLKRGKP